MSVQDKMREKLNQLSNAGIISYKRNTDRDILIDELLHIGGTKTEELLEDNKELNETIEKLILLNDEQVKKHSEYSDDKIFIMWAKEQKIQIFKRGELEVHFHPSAFVEKVDYGDVPEAPKEPEIDYKTDLSKVSDDDLFHSAN